MTLDVSTDLPAGTAPTGSTPFAEPADTGAPGYLLGTDSDPDETREWMDSLDAVIAHHGIDRAQFILAELLRRAQAGNLKTPALVQTPYVNTIAPEFEPPYPGDEEIELKIRRFIRWNAVTMVMRGQSLGAAGGHLATYASAATLYEVGFNHFFRGKDAPDQFGTGDHIFFQGHASPGIYARAFLEGRLSEDQLTHFRREVTPGQGLSSYPHPWLMPNFWEFPTVSMGLGPLAAIYQARYDRYLQHRGIADTSQSRVWAFLGDGETDEPEALGSLHLAAREGLSNLIFVVNCNLQRLDGPVRGNGKIIQELEAVFHGAGWNVIKVIWGREWDHLLANDHDGLLVRRMGAAVDGEYQKASVEGGAYIREKFFGTHPRLAAMVAHLSDAQLVRLRRGGHDLQKVYAAYDAAVRESQRPTVILAKTVKGWLLGESAEGKNVAHQVKKIELDELRKFRDRLDLPVADSQLENPPFLKFAENSREFQYLQERRRALGGYLPQRRAKPQPIPAKPLEWFGRYMKGSGTQEASTTGIYGRILADLLGDKELGKRIVPIIPDEARTFGLDALFNRFGIYSSKGQLYEPVDSKSLMKYREARDGVVLEEGICEAGSMASFTAVATSYATHGVPMIPMYIFYSMFGLQRTGDQAWAFGDQRARGFLLGATAGRTTLNGEGLQHQDGHSHLLATTFPAIDAYDPAFGYEIAVIVQNGLDRMLTKEHDVVYYVTLQNEAYVHPEMPAGVSPEDIVRGLYKFRAVGPAESKGKLRAHLIGSGSIMMQVLRAAEILTAKYNVAADVWSATSYQQLRREALACERWNMLHPEAKPRVPYVARTLAGVDGPVIAASDYMKSVSDQIGQWVPGGLTSLGTDGYGRSDSREALRRHFEVDPESIVVATLHRLAAAGKVKPAAVAQAIKELGVNPDKIDPQGA